MLFIGEAQGDERNGEGTSHGNEIFLKGFIGAYSVVAILPF